MVTTISGKHMDIGNSLREYVNERIEIGIKKHLHDLTQAKIIFSKNHHLYHADIIIHDSHVGHLKAESESDDVYAAFDIAIVKIEKQLRKYKSKIKKNNHSKTIREADHFVEAVKYTLNMPSVPENSEEHDHEPITIAEVAHTIEKLTVSEAIMKMEFVHVPALMFINKLNNRMNMVYHRADGNIAWVDTK
jgi:ribosomal subunit interface protein